MPRVLGSAHDADMGKSETWRVENAISGLVEILILPVADEDSTSLDERRDRASALATNVIDRSGTIRSEPLRTTDIA